MTEAQATALRTKWKQHGDPPPLCKHPIMELTRLVRSDDDSLLRIYHCCACGEAIVHTHQPPSFSNMPLIDSPSTPLR